MTHTQAVLAIEMHLAHRRIENIFFVLMLTMPSEVECHNSRGVLEYGSCEGP